jgi:hypothetical protein
VDESEIDSANETATFGWPFRFGNFATSRVHPTMIDLTPVSCRVVKRGRLLVWLAVLVGLALIAVAVVYWAEPAKSLPSWLPGHEVGSNHHHVKHGIAAFLLGLACLVFAWFRSAGPRPRSAAV